MSNFLRENRDLNEAVESARKAVSLDPTSPNAHNTLGKGLWEQGERDAAIVCYEKALELMPAYPEALCNLGVALWARWRIDEAIVYYQRALTLRPDYPEALNNLGNAFKDTGQLDEAIACYHHALTLNLRHSDAYDNLVTKKLGSVGSEEAIASYRRRLESSPKSIVAHSSLLMTMHYHPKYQPEKIFTESKYWNQLHGEPLRKIISRHVNERIPGKRIRVGYVSPDFHDHPVGRFIAPLLASHNHERFEIICYAEPPCVDGITTQLQAHADIWRNISGLSDKEVADLIRHDQVDILVDLAGHTPDNRLRVFACKPAPVQVTYLGYPGTTGLNAVDYRLTDSFADPPGLTDPYHSEKLIRLPRSAWCFSELADAPEVNAAPAIRKGFLTFGCLNNYCKVNSALMALWAKILKATRDSHLIVLTPEGSARKHFLGALGAEGVDVERVEVVPTQSRSDYLETFQRIDVSLDPFPYHGTATTCDSLWMGVPVVTLAGRSHVSRVGVSLLSNLGLHKFIASTPEQYVNIAEALALDMTLLTEIRLTLRSRMRNAPLMDAVRFTRDTEDAFRKMWLAWCSAPSGLRPN